MIFDRLNNRIPKREIERAKAERDDYLARKEAECAILREKSGNETIFITDKKIFLTILLLPVKIRKPVFISVKHLSVLGAPGGCNHSVPSSSLGWPLLQFSFATMMTWFSY